MALRATRPRVDEAHQRAEIEARREAYRARCLRHERVIVAFLGFLTALTIVAALMITRAIGV